MYFSTFGACPSHIIQLLIISITEFIIYNNLFRYTETKTTFYQNMKLGIALLKTSNQAALWLGFLGIIWMLYKRRWMMCFFLVSSILSTFSTVFGGGRFFNYYSFIFSVFTVFGICFLTELFTRSAFLLNKNLCYCVLSVWKTCTFVLLRSRAQN